MKLIRRDSSN